MIPVALPRTKREPRAIPQFQCVTCLGFFPLRGNHSKTKRSCLECEALRDRARNAAMRAVKREWKAGRMLKPDAYKCVDCGEPATMYDHRDYTKPLEVQPVCRSCNGLRGPGSL